MCKQLARTSREDWKATKEEQRKELLSAPSLNNEATLSRNRVRKKAVLCTLPLFPL